MRKKRLLIPLLISLCLIFATGSLSAMAATDPDASGQDYTYDGTTFSMEKDLDGDLLVSKAGENNYTTEADKVFEVAAGDKVDLEASLDAAPVKEQLSDLQALLTQKVNEKYAELIKDSPILATTLNNPAILAQFMNLNDTESSFEAKFTIPEGLTAPEDLAASAKLTAGSVYEIQDVAVSGSEITVTMTLKDSESIKTLGDLQTRVESLPEELLLELPGFVASEPDTKYVVKGEMTGGLSSEVSADSQLVEALEANGLSAPGNKKVELTWNAVQSADGKDAEAADTESIQLTIQTSQSGGQEEETSELDGDLLVKNQADSEYNTEHDSVFETTPGNTVDLEACLDVSSVKDQLAEMQDKLLAKVPDEYKTALGEEALKQLIGENVKLEGTDSVFTAVFEIPEGLTLPDDLASSVDLTSSEGADKVLYKVDNASSEGGTVTVTMVLKDTYDTFGALRDAVQEMPDDLLLDISGIVTENEPAKTYTITGELSGYLKTTASGSFDVLTFARDIDLSWEAVQSADGTDAVLGGAENPPIQLTIKTLSAVEESSEVEGDLLVRNQADTENTEYDTEHEKVFEIEPGDTVDVEACLAVSSVKEQLTEMQNEFLAKIPEDIKAQVGENALKEQIGKSVKLEGTDSVFTAVFEIPDGLTLPDDLSSNVALTSSEGADKVLYEVENAAFEDGKLTVTMVLKEDYATFGDLRTAVEGMPDDLLLDITGIKSADEDATYVITGELSGYLKTTASGSVAEMTLARFIDLSWEAVQSADGTDAVLGDAENPPIQLTIKASKPTLNKEDHVAYIIGYPDGTVKPEANITRAEVATIFFRLLTDESRAKYWSQTNDFSDVKDTDWFNNAVSTMSKAGIINGYPDGTFKPNNQITRAEFATIAARFDSTQPDTSGSKLTDISGHWAEDYIKKAEALGYIAGYEDGSFKPDQPITRAEAMTLINRVLERMEDNRGIDGLLPESEMNVWTDNMNKNAWYYTAVQEATNSHTYDKDNKQAITEGNVIHYTETWIEKIADPDWAALEKEWSTANGE